MRRFGRSVLVLAVAVLIAAPALAAKDNNNARNNNNGQGRGGFGSLMLLTQKSVQEELKLTDDQVKKVQDLQAKGRENAQGLRNLSQEERQQKIAELAKTNEQALAGILQPEQAKRLKQITLQRRGAGALADPEVATALNLTDDQKEKLKTIQDDARKNFQDLRGGNNNNSDDSRKKMEELRNSTQEKAMSVLTDDQKAKLKELTGEPFKGEITRPTNNRPRSNQ